MPRVCAVLECQNIPSRYSQEVKLFRFPLKDENRLPLWMEVVNRGTSWKPTAYSRLCSSHFERLEFDSKKRLITDPVLSSFKSTSTPSTKTSTVPVLNLAFGKSVSLNIQMPSTVAKTNLSPQKFMKTVATQTSNSCTCDQLKSENQVLRSKNKVLRRRLKKKQSLCNKLEYHWNMLWSKLEQCVLLKTLILQLLIPTKSRIFSSSVRAFTQSLHYYSSRAHAFVRTSFNNLLPHERMIGRWNKHVHLQPGFVEASLNHIREMASTAKTQLYCSLQFDEVHIREQLISNGDSFDGYVDYGGYYLHKKPDTIANSALVLMAVGLNKNWKIPIAFFFTKGLPTKFLVKIIPEALSRLDSTGSICKAIVSDGLSSNQTCMKKLGANLDPEDPRPWFTHPNGKDRVFVIMDACHMLKLLRNLWKHFKVLLNNKQILRWDLINRLVRHQETEGLRAANKLTSRHSQFELQKMKVHLAAQLFSSSVSNALLFCEDIGIKGFSNSGPTATFISTIDKLFDSLNSINPVAKGCKAPLSSSNKNYWQPLFKRSESMLLNLHVSTIEGTVPVYKTKRKTAIVGLICTMRSISELMSELVLCPDQKMKYLLTYKLSQDHLETFFSSVRTVLGCNPNPNVLQFKSALKKILTAKILPQSNGNCIPQDDTQTSILNPNTKLSNPINSSTSQDEDIPEMDITKLSQFTSCVVTYIAGWVVRKLKGKIRCQVCLSALESVSCGGSDHTLILRKQNGGLIVPSDDVIKICKTAESAYKQEAISPNFRKLRIQQAVLSQVITNNVFESLNGHLFDTEPEDNHISQLTKIIVDEYLALRMHHTAKVTTLQNKRTTNRNHNTSITNFSGV